MKLFGKNHDQQPRRQPQLMEGQNEFTFRRSRTLTGSPSSDIKAAAEDRSHLQSPRLRLHQLEQHRRLLGFGLLVSFIAVLLLGWLVGQFIRVPSDMDIAGSPLIQPNTATYKETIESYFGQRPTERFLFHLDQQKLREFVVQRHPEIKSLTISSAVPGHFSVDMSLRKPLLKWETGSTQLFVDETGASFGDNYFSVPLVAVEDRSGIRLEDVNVIASNRFVSFLGRMVNSVNEAGVGSVSKVIIPAGVTREVDIQLANRPYLIKTHIDRDPTQQAHDLVQAVKFMDQNKVTPEYIDVRIAGKAYFKEK
ncbi:hypothetical protein CYG49_04195 [Candidatus Saccharibacteria bacterium]|nr:MAG: hypothetical protein CYG49_04195 [Candidatus Saccharibacteria bacterium]